MLGPASKRQHFQHADNDRPDAESFLMREAPACHTHRTSPFCPSSGDLTQATQDIRKVSLWLGHATLTTTEVYTRGDPTEKLDAMEAIVPPHLRRGAFQPTDKLIALLKRAS
jgi:integrase